MSPFFGDWWIRITHLLAGACGTSERQAVLGAHDRLQNSVHDANWWYGGVLPDQFKSVVETKGKAMPEGTKRNWTDFIEPDSEGKTTFAAVKVALKSVLAVFPGEQLMVAHERLQKVASLC